MTFAGDAIVLLNALPVELFIGGSVGYVSGQGCSFTLVAVLTLVNGGIPILGAVAVVELLLGANGTRYLLFRHAHLDDLDGR